MPTTSLPLPWYRDSLAIARSLLIAQLIFLLFSPPLTNLVEGLLYLQVLASSVLRQRLLAAVRQPMVAMALLFAAVLWIAMSYGPAPRAEAWSMLTGWRRLLMLPIGVALFDTPRWKLRALWIYIVLIDVCAVLSFIAYATHMIISHYELGIVVRNHSTQGMMFAVAAFAAAIMLRDTGAQGPLSRRQKWALGLSVLVLLANIVLITSGRSGYLVALVCAVVWAVSSSSRNRLGWRQIGLALATVLVIGAALFVSPVARNGIEKGVHEAMTYQQSSQLTSIGIRMVFLKNTLQIIQQHPWIGVGTGGFRAAYLQQLGHEQGWEAAVTTDPHNQFLKILTEQGVVGLLIFIGFIASAFRQQVPQPFRVIGLGVLCAWCATSLFNSHFSTFSEGRFIFIWCGMLLAMQNHESDESEVNRV